MFQSQIAPLWSYRSLNETLTGCRTKCNNHLWIKKIFHHGIINVIFSMPLVFRVSILSGRVITHSLNPNLRHCGENNLSSLKVTLGTVFFLSSKRWQIAFMESPIYSVFLHILLFSCPYVVWSCEIHPCFENNDAHSRDWMEERTENTLSQFRATHLFMNGFSVFVSLFH